MARKTHNDTKDPAGDTCRRPGCSHVRSKHQGACTGLHYDPFGPAAKCECTAFVEPLPPRAAPLEIYPRVTMNLTWEGEPPVIGDFLLSSGRNTRYAYRIIDLYEPARRDPHAQRRFEIGALQIPLDDFKKITDAVTVHTFKWSERARTLKTAGTGWSSKD